ncbi:MAG: PE-PPE domain-containing protein [Corynebacterium sp.]|jgi:pimeloyl-ACP methyl ester carboxylesterase|nr:PE-PPE domain-containing protein [Corynebacterium sp.]
MGWREVADKLDGLQTVLHAVITVNGTWGAGLVQYPSDVVNGLAQYINPDLCEEVVCPYPASFGPIGGNSSGDSYQQSVDAGVAWIAQWIVANPLRTFALIGYSQGAEVASRVAMALMGQLDIGVDLTPYAANWIGGITFGNPCRMVNSIAPGVANPGSYRGISSINMVSLPTINGEIVWADYAHSKANGDAGLDMYACVPVGQVGTIMTDVYTTATAMQLNDPAAFMQAMVTDLMRLVEDSGIIKGFAGGILGLLGMGVTALEAFLIGLVTGPQGNATGVAADVQAALAGLAFLTAPGGATAPHISYLGEIPGYTNLVAKAVGFLYQLATLTPARAA